MSYLHYQEEICPSTSRHHYQGFLKFKVKKRFKQAKAQLMAAFKTTLSPRMCVTNGSIASNVEYCSKAESRVPGTWPTILGEVPTNESNGKPCMTPDIIDVIFRRKLTPAQALLDEDVPMGVKTYALRNARTWDYVRTATIAHRDESIAPTVIVLYGVPRSGKSTLASFMTKDVPRYKKMNGCKYWEEYMGEKYVIYEDFDGSSMTPQDFKNVFDWPQMLVEKKGGSVPLTATYHIITTNVYPSHWWSLKALGQDGRDAVWQRFTQLWYFPFKGRKAVVYDDPIEFRGLPMNFTLEASDPKGEKQINH